MILYDSNGYIYAKCDDCGTNYKGGCLTPENLNKLMADQGWNVPRETFHVLHLCLDCWMDGGRDGRKDAMHDG